MDELKATQKISRKNYVSSNSALSKTLKSGDLGFRKTKAKNILQKTLQKTQGYDHKNKLTPGQRAADAVARFGGSWTFIVIFLGFLILWMILNSIILVKYEKSFDAYPYILLNLVLSCLAAIQAPIILMSQNRAAERDRIKADRDYAINRKAERENQIIMRDLEQMKKMLKAMEQKKI
ncbi:cyclic nucleotide-binding protein [Candidatus Woesearchaeota archaeon]|nr:MAG: cyclic nucleotide-binding protein [Candidatus Woesearchaeota archaeon]